jgi:hypothetical protein
MIKTDHAKSFGARDIQRVGDQRDNSVIDVTELLLQVVQNWQRGAQRIALTIDQRSSQIQIKGRSARHGILPSLHKRCAREGFGSN